MKPFHQHKAGMNKAGRTEKHRYATIKLQAEKGAEALVRPPGRRSARKAG
jgi:hypothetical protein